MQQEDRKFPPSAASILVHQLTMVGSVKLSVEQRLSFLVVSTFQSCICFRFAIVSPIEGQTKLQLEQEGLDVLRRLKGPVSPVVVIGPYRSGKSFLLNQLLGVGCGKKTVPIATFAQSCLLSFWDCSGPTQPA